MLFPVKCLLYIGFVETVDLHENSMLSTSIALLIGLSSSFNVIQSSFPLSLRRGGDENIAVSSIQENKKKSFFQNILIISDRPEKKTSKGLFASSEFQSDSAAEAWFLSSSQPPMYSGQQVQSLSVFVATWNVGGKSPRFGINLDDFLQIDHSSDLYVLGFQEIVPLNAGNVLVIEDNDPAARWLGSINQSLNKPVNMNSRGSKIGGSLFFPKPSLKSISNTFRTESSRRLKNCNCAPYDLERKRSKDLWFRCQPSPPNEEDGSSEEVDDESTAFDVSGIYIHQNANQIKYSLVACKQMVGIFVTIWMKKELVPLVSHLRISCVSRGIMGCLGNKGCISVSMLFQQTSFCFICSHLASGEKEGDELRRNVDVVEILKNTQFPKISRTVCSRMPEKIIEHDRVIWFGDLNYRIALSFSETRRLMAENHWDELLNKDQLSMEREAGRVFGGWKEGSIYFAPTYKYWCNSDAYAADVKKSKKYRRTPAWCDRVLWHGDGIRQVSYIRGESRFSDHRPVCATFLVDVGVVDGGLKKGLPEKNRKIGKEEILPPSKH